MATIYNPNIVTDKLVLCLDAANAKSYSGSGTDWKDLSGKGNHATLVNSPTYVQNSNGGYFSFDGDDAHATLPAIDLTGNEVTFSIWCYTQSSGGDSGSLIFLGDSGSSTSGRILNIHSIPYGSNDYYFDKGYDGGTGSSSYDRLSGTFSDASEYSGWINWCFTANASTGSMKMYRNGILFNSATGKTKTLTNANGDIRRIGRTNGSACYDGYMSNLQLYKKELTAAEVLQNYDAYKGRYM